MKTILTVMVAIVGILVIAFVVYSQPWGGPGMDMGTGMGPGTTVSTGDKLLMETGDVLLLETGDKILLE